MDGERLRQAQRPPDRRQLACVAYFADAQRTGEPAFEVCRLRMTRQCDYLAKRHFRQKVPTWPVHRQAVKMVILGIGPGERKLKIQRLERLAQSQRDYHRTHPWRLSHGGLYVPHSYADKKPESLSFWDTVGFILNGRRFIVWWQHPRHAYATAIEVEALKAVGPSPRDNWLFEGGTKNCKRVGRSRKRQVGYTCREPSTDQSHYYEQLRQTIARLSTDGIDHDVAVSWKQQRLKWAMGVSLVAPLEVRNECDLAGVANLARSLILGRTTLAAEFPGYRYGAAEWLREQRAET